MSEPNDDDIRCWYYQSPGGCSNPNCTYVHDEKFPARPPNCVFWDEGNCRNESSCTFFHDSGNDEDVRGPIENIPKVMVMNEKKSFRKNRRRKNVHLDDGWTTVVRKR